MNRRFGFGRRRRMGADSTSSMRPDTCLASRASPPPPKRPMGLRSQTRSQPRRRSPTDRVAIVLLPPLEFASDVLPVTLILQVRGAVPTSAVDLVRYAPAVTQAVLALLALLSLISWTVMFTVWRQI